MGGESSSPSDCETSQQAREIGNRMYSYGESALGDADGEFGVGNAAAAASHFKQASQYYARAEELEKQGK